MGIWLTLFAVVFGLGPWVFLRLMRLTPSTGVLARLALAMVICATASLWLRFLAPVPWGVNIWATWLGIGLIWAAWIAVLALVALALRQVDSGRAMRRWTGIMGAIGTTVPWFGLASARLMSS
ncbi:hypothetical protein [Pseudosulfitobacter sp. DSM 107133]|jgi:hypothetical protein|uniref:hypothetical protein n=1 Tax=Pseudosulfitobacter sp. DSM 107133 TaxID=2883100 RepID=UPI000DF2D0CF|nr:hypothetical protein [Pseudosulfitobacter sp. DSM 107133]UOA28591.1 hypothetical protein DSM107133_03340 [Pseudosulfitobacter sp. DSM 107133]